MKKIIFNGEAFEVISSDMLYDDICEALERHRYPSLYKAYEKPSEKKVEIFNDWVEWSKGVNIVKPIEIIARNANTFTLGAVIEKNGVFLALCITKAHNRAYIVDKALFERLEA